MIAYAINIETENLDGPYVEGTYGTSTWRLHTQRVKNILLHAHDIDYLNETLNEMIGFNNILKQIWLAVFEKFKKT